MPWLLNCGYILLVIAALPVLGWKAWKFGKYRNGWSQKFGGNLPALAPTEKTRVWFHAVSVGEVNLLPGIVRQLKLEIPDLEVIITTTTDTGMEVARKQFPKDVVAYCPLDFSWAVQRAFNRLKPNLLVLAELELWPNLIAAAKGRGIPVAVVNARLGDRSFRGYHRVRWLLRPMLRSLSLVAAQDTATAERFISLGIDPERVKVTGSVKFDGAPTDRKDPTVVALATQYGARPEQQIFVAGSTIDPEEIIALETYRKLSPSYPELRLIIVPRHPERFEQVATLIRDFGYTCLRRSQSHSQNQSGPNSTPCSQVWRNQEVILVDTIGELRAWWGLAQIAFVGGSMGSRGDRTCSSQRVTVLPLPSVPIQKTFEILPIGCSKRVGQHGLPIRMRCFSLCVNHLINHN